MAPAPDDPHPLVSVILPTYNCLGYLREAIGSVVEQRFTDWELIVVDDGSTDGTTAWLERLADPRMRLIRLAHSGNPARVRNAGLEASTGDWLAFLDADDRWLPQRLDQQLQGFRQQPGCAWGYCSLTPIDATGAETPFPVGAAFTPYAGRILDKLITRKAVIGTSCVMAGRRLVQELGGFDESMPVWEAWDLWIRLGARSQVAVTATPLVQIRFHDASYTQGRWEEHRYRIRMYEKVLAMPQAKPWRSLARRQILMAVLSFASWFRRAGQSREALRVLADTFLQTGWHPSWWASLLKTVVPHPIRRHFGRRDR